MVLTLEEASDEIERLSQTVSELEQKVQTLWTIALIDAENYGIKLLELLSHNAGGITIEQIVDEARLRHGDVVALDMRTTLENMIFNGLLEKDQFGHLSVGQEGYRELRRRSIR